MDTGQRHEEMDEENGTVREIEPVEELDAEVAAPPSKAFTLRGLFIAALAEGQSELRNALNAEDQRHAADALRQFGAEITYDDGTFFVQGTGGDLAAPPDTVYTGQSGVTSRFIIPFAALAPGTTVIDAAEQMRGRPVGDLVEALRDAGVAVESRDGYPPVRVQGGTWTAGDVSVSVEDSSQYLSAILISAPYVDGDVTVRMEGSLRSEPYVDMTLDMMETFGSRIERADGRRFRVRNQHRYRGRVHEVEGDYSSASYFFAAAAVTGGRVRVENLDSNSLQGDRYVLDVLSQMGCEVRWLGKNVVAVTGGELRSITINMGDYPDLVPTLAVVAAFADGETRIQNVGHLAYKESDRLQSTARNLRASGIDVGVTSSSLRIEGGNPGPVDVDPVGDHRIAMAFSVLGLVTPGVRIEDPHVVNKSFPDFFERFDQLYGEG